jgi:hypothetical protein
MNGCSAIQRKFNSHSNAEFTLEGKQEVVGALGVASRGASSDHVDAFAALDWEDPVKPDRHVLQMPLCHVSWLQLNSQANHWQPELKVGVLEKRPILGSHYFRLAHVAYIVYS